MFTNKIYRFYNDFQFILSKEFYTWDNVAIYFIDLLLKGYNYYHKNFY